MISVKKSKKALQKLKKAEVVKEVYRAILNEMDNKQVNPDEDILVVKRTFFTKRKIPILKNLLKRGSWMRTNSIYHLFNI